MTDTIRLYHNARCSKSRSACALLADKGVPTTIIEYLKTPPTREELAAVLAALGMRAEDLVRKGEDVFKATFKGRTLSEDEWLDALVAHPI
ncbi:MAG TPA: arsenate reductase (glutaredoxin), partial [Rhodocyclaceae bacterium]|nr:arsenate reductase (glutaredoxin) [Rhodocyclaceae bacterium]